VGILCRFQRIFLAENSPVSAGMIERAMFESPWWAVALNPHYLARRGLWHAMRDASHALHGRVLDVGCGTQPYRQLLVGAQCITGLELDTVANHARKNADAYYDGVDFPFDNSCFESVLCNQVLEHVFMPERFLSEISRVLVPGGAFVISVPFAWPEHERPWDCRRYSSYGLKDVLERTGFDVVCQLKLVRGAAALFALAADQINEASRPLPSPLRLLARLAVICPLSLCGLFVGCFARADSTFYLDNFVVARKRAGGPAAQ
jgi:SAM-dependent methyltransferase